MRRASVHDIRYHFAQIEKLLEGGEEIEITRYNRVVARLLPATNRGALSRPDFAGLLRRIYGEKKLASSGAKLIACERGRY